jgi:hypothetical protein
MRRGGRGERIGAEAVNHFACAWTPKSHELTAGFSRGNFMTGVNEMISTLVCLDH